MASWKDMTPEQRSGEMKKRRAVAKANKRKPGRKKRAKQTRKAKGAQQDGHSSPKDELEKHSWYLFGKVETILDIYSASAGIPRAALTRGLARLLRD